MKLFAKWWRKPQTGVTIMLGKNSRVPLLEATVDDLRRGAKVNRAQAAKIRGRRQAATLTSRRERRARREEERARFCEHVAIELERRRRDRVRKLPRRRQREIIDRAEVLARPVI